MSKRGIPDTVKDAIYDIVSEYGPGALRYATQSASDYWNAPPSKRTRSSTHRASSSALVIRGGASGSKSSGFVSLAKTTKGTFDKYLKKGVVQCTETGGEAKSFNATGGAGLSAQVVYVGHTTANPGAMKYVVAQAILKKLCLKANIRLADMETLIHTATVANEGLEIRAIFRTSPKEDPTVLDTAASPIGWNIKTETPNQIATKIFDTLFPSIRNDQREWVQINMYGIVGTTAILMSSLEMEGLMLHFKTKSSFKMQNRSASSANTDEDAVDNVPLYGRSYGGTGNGAMYRGTNTSAYQGKYPFTATENAWNIAPAPPDVAVTPVARLWREPPSPKEFVGVTESGKVHLDPGHVKTHVMLHEGGISFDRFYKMLYSGDTAPAGGYGKFFFGKYTFFCLEKMIQAVTTTATNQIIVGYEVDTKQGCFVKEKKSNITRMLVYQTPV